MTAATAFSAIATAAAVIVGYYQNQTAKDALVANDRNKAFQEYSEALEPMCQRFNAKRQVGMSIFPSTKPERDKFLRTYLADHVQDVGPPDAIYLLGFARNYATKFRALKIWSSPGAKSGLSQLEHLNYMFISAEGYKESVNSKVNRW